MCEESLNFDVAGLRVHSYDIGDLKKARSSFASYLNAALQSRDQVKHLTTERAVRGLDADCLTYMAQSASHSHFSVPVPVTMGEVMALVGSGIKAAARHLLSQGIIEFDSNPTASQYAYHWTAFGDAVLKRLGLRAPNTNGPTP